jgi:hypothetical protein
LKSEKSGIAKLDALAAYPKAAKSNETIENSDDDTDDRAERIKRRNLVKDAMEPRSKGKAKMQDVRTADAVDDIAVDVDMDAIAEETMEAFDPIVEDEDIVPKLSQVSIATSGLPPLTQTSSDVSMSLGSPFVGPVRTVPESFPELDRTSEPLQDLGKYIVFSLLVR